VLGRTAESESNGVPFEMEYRYLRKDGRVVWVRDAAVLIDRTPDGRPWRFQGVMMDVTDRKEAEEVLRDSETEVRRSLEVLERTDEERRQLLRHLVAMEAADRERLAAGIEDRSLQDFAAVGLRLDVLRRALADPEQRGASDRLGETVQQALARLRHLLVELRPRELDTEGLAAALEQYLRAVAPPGIRSTVRNAVAHEPDPGVRGLAYRIGQDALAWAFERVREGEVEQESEIAVDVEMADEGTLVRVRCDACGTAPSSDDDAALVSIRERADLAGGWARVRAEGSAATTLEFWLPERLTGAS
jgi:signal transduction histidine kinase